MGTAADLVLASASPRRRELLERLGLVLRVLPVDLDETPNAGEKAADYVRRMAAAKCHRACQMLGEETDPDAVTIDGAVPPCVLPVLAADTIVVLDGEILGKAADAEQARGMLRRLAGRRHEVITAYQIRCGSPRLFERAVSTTVAFRLLDPAEIEAYLASGEWEGKAGAYAVQGIAGAFTSELRGSHTNVIGLPLAEVIGDLRAAGALTRYPPPRFGA
jgi:septum formation protein